MNPVKEGDLMPAFIAHTTQGSLSSEELRGQPVVLFFYPRNNTPGCTMESRDFRDLHPQFEAAGCRVLGISRDSAGSDQRVVDKLGLPYALVADPDETLSTRFGVMKHKSMFGKAVRGIERSTFLFGPDGRLARQWRKVKVPGHADEVLQAVHALD